MKMRPGYGAAAGLDPACFDFTTGAPAISLSDFVTGDLDHEDRSNQMALSVRMHCCRDVGEHAGIRAAAAKETQHPCHHG